MTPHLTSVGKVNFPRELLKLNSQILKLNTSVHSRQFKKFSAKNEVVWFLLRQMLLGAIIF